MSSLETVTSCSPTGRARKEASRSRFYQKSLIPEAHVLVQLVTGADVGTIKADPQFVNYQEDGSGDYHVTRLSPARGVGLKVDILTHDFEGRLRPVAENPTLGAHQFIE